MNNESSQIGKIDAKCILVVPCYNEENRLMTAAFEDFFRAEAGEELGMLFVNDGSKDNTLSVLEQLQARNPLRVEILNLKHNSGKAEAVRRGMLVACAKERTEITGFWDADLATPLYELPTLLKILAENGQLEMVFGTRIRILGRDIQRKAMRHYLGRIFATAASLVLKLPIYDTQCGAKLFRVTPALVDILSEPFHSRWIFDVELIARFIKHKGYDRSRVLGIIYEYPLTKWEDVKGSKIGPFDFVRAFGELVWIHFWISSSAR